MKLKPLHLIFAAAVLFAAPAAFAGTCSCPDADTDGTCGSVVNDKQSVIEEFSMEGNCVLETTFTAMNQNGSAVAISRDPSSEQTYRSSVMINPNAIDLCAGPNCRLVIFRGQGNRDNPFKPAGSVRETHRIILKKLGNGAYRALIWVRDYNSTNPGFWEQAAEPFFSNGTTNMTIMIEWQASSDGASDGFIRVYKDGALFDEMTNIRNELDVDQARLGHVGGGVASGAIGSFWVDDFQSFRTLAP